MARRRICRGKASHVALLCALLAATPGCSESDAKDSAQEAPRVPAEAQIFEWVKDVTSFGVRLPDSPGSIQETGLLAPRGLFVSNEIEGLERIALGAMSKHGLERTVAFPTKIFGGVGIPADCSDFYAAGLPVMALVGAPIYLYDSIDTLDKVPQAELGRVARAFTEVVTQLDALPSGAFRRLKYGSE